MQKNTNFQELLQQSSGKAMTVINQHVGVIRLLIRSSFFHFVSCSNVYWVDSLQFTSFFQNMNCFEREMCSRKIIIVWISEKDVLVVCGYCKPCSTKGIILSVCVRDYLLQSCWALIKHLRKTFFVSATSFWFEQADCWCNNSYVTGSNTLLSISFFWFWLSKYEEQIKMEFKIRVWEFDCSGKEVSRPRRQCWLSFNFASSAWLYTEYER